MTTFISINYLVPADLDTSINTWTLQVVDRTAPIYEDGQRIYAPGKTIWVCDTNDLIPVIMDIHTDPSWELSVIVNVYDYSISIGNVVVVKKIRVTL